MFCALIASQGAPWNEAESHAGNPDQDDKRHSKRADVKATVKNSSP